MRVLDARYRSGHEVCRPRVGLAGLRLEQLRLERASLLGEAREDQLGGGTIRGRRLACTFDATLQIPRVPLRKTFTHRPAQQRMSSSS